LGAVLLKTTIAARVSGHHTGIARMRGCEDFFRKLVLFQKRQRLLILEVRRKTEGFEVCEWPYDNIKVISGVPEREDN
jgi:hypothetical protein